MHFKVQQAVGAEGHNIFTSIHSWMDVTHDAESCGGEGGSLEVQNQHQLSG